MNEIFRFWKRKCRKCCEATVEPQHYFFSRSDNRKFVGETFTSDVMWHFSRCQHRVRESTMILLNLLFSHSVITCFIPFWCHALLLTRRAALEQDPGLLDGWAMDSFHYLTIEWEWEVCNLIVIKISSWKCHRRSHWMLLDEFIMNHLGCSGKGRWEWVKCRVFKVYLILTLYKKILFLKNISFRYF